MNNFVNIAFVSYKREDEKWAKWLQRNLEAYKLPAIIRKENPSLPKYVRPIFRDKTDLGAGSLQDKLKEELRSSKYLIVICSKKSAKSLWVGREISYFAKERDIECIIPFIIDGTPGTRDDNECLNPEFYSLDKELLGININEIGKKQAFIKVVSKLLGLRFDDLWRRHERSRKRKLRIGISLAVPLALLAVYLLEAVRTEKMYSEYICDINGVTNPVKWIDKKDLDKVSCYYEFYLNHPPLTESLGFGPRRITRIQYHSKSKALCLTTPPQPEPYWSIVFNSIDYSYSKENGTPYLAALSRFNSIPIIKLHQAELKKQKVSIVDFESGTDGNGVAYMLEDYFTGTQTGISGGISRLSYERDTLGRISKVSFHSNNNFDLTSNRITNHNGVFSIAYEWNDNYRCMSETYLDLDGNIMAGKNGIASIKYDYSPDGRLVGITRRDANGSPVRGANGWAILKTERDNYGNIVRESLFDESGNLIEPNDEIQYAVAEIKYDESGRAIEEKFKDNKGNPAVFKDVISRVEAYYYGKWTGEIYYDINDEPIAHPDGYTIGEARYDESWNILECKLFDKNKNPVLCCYGFHHYVQTFTPDGNIKSIRYYGLNDEPVNTPENGFEIRFGYNERGLLQSENTFDISGTPFVNEQGYSEHLLIYDDKGNLQKEGYFTPDGEPCNIDLGYGFSFWEVCNFYDENANLIRQEYHDKYGNLVAVKE